MSDLVGNPEDQFFHVAAHIKTMVLSSGYRGETIIMRKHVFLPLISSAKY